MTEISSSACADHHPMPVLVQDYSVASDEQGYSVRVYCDSCGFLAYIHPEQYLAWMEFPDPNLDSEVINALKNLSA